MLREVDVTVRVRYLELSTKPMDRLYVLMSLADNCELATAEAVRPPYLMHQKQINTCDS